MTALTWLSWVNFAHIAANWLEKSLLAVSVAP